RIGTARSSVATVRAIGRTLSDVEETTSWGAFALKVRGKMFVCTAINKAAEPNSLVVRMDFAQRDALLAEDPDTFYLKDHYIDYPCVLVRLSKVHPDALRDLVAGAHRFVSATLPKRKHPAVSRRASKRR
ncbi:MAG TPA: MmcQ/YjbR family DNA-binding protein, partial [Vicinamibacterales bacterium]|nr:MmcQ/YjbR family DNA-binding protein [Vicinamibacterales bacterium]